MAPQHRLYTPEIAETILERLADGEGLATICADEGMPSRGAVRHWVEADHDGFAARYARARIMGLEHLADEIIPLADAATDVDSASAARVKVDARKWILSKLMPKQFGDRVEVSHEIKVSDVPDDKLNSRLNALLAARPVVVIPPLIEGSAEPDDHEDGEPK